MKRIVEDHSLTLAESLQHALAQGRTRRKGPRYHVLFIIDRDHEPGDPLTFVGETAARGLTVRGEAPPRPLVHLPTLPSLLAGIVPKPWDACHVTFDSLHLTEGAEEEGSS